MPDFYFMSRMTDDGVSVKFNHSLSFDSIDECVKTVLNEIKSEIEKTYAPEARENIFIPTEEQIRDSFINDSYVNYILVEGSTEIKMIYHISHIGLKMLEIK